MLADEFFRSVDPTRRRGQYRLGREVPIDVGGEAVGCLVPPGAVLLQGLHHDPVEITRQCSLQLRRIDAATGRDAGQPFRRAHLRARTGRIDFPHHAQHLEQRTALELRCIQRRRTGEQLVEDHAQRIDVGPCVDVHRRWVRLLGRHIGRRADDRSGIAQTLVGQVELRGLGHAEIDDLGRGTAVDLGDHHVRRLEVAVDDSFLMGMLHRLANGHEQLQPSPNRQPFAVAVIRDRQAVHQFHHKERLAGVGGASVVNAGDVRVIHQGQRLAFGVEPGQNRASPCQA